jgi:hypothetical protein
MRYPYLAKSCEQKWKNSQMLSRQQTNLLARSGACGSHARETCQPIKPRNHATPGPAEQNTAALIGLGERQHLLPSSGRSRANKIASAAQRLDEVQRGGIAAWKALRDLLPRDEDIPSGSPSVSFSQLFIAAHEGRHER